MNPTGTHFLLKIDFGRSGKATAFRRCRRRTENSETLDTQGGNGRSHSFATDPCRQRCVPGAPTRPLRLPAFVPRQTNKFWAFADIMGALRRDLGTDMEYDLDRGNLIWITICRGHFMTICIIRQLPGQTFGISVRSLARKYALSKCNLHGRIGRLVLENVRGMAYGRRDSVRDRAAWRCQPEDLLTGSGLSRLARTSQEDCRAV